MSKSLHPPGRALLKLALVPSLGLALAGQPALAQETQTNEIETVVITGTRLSGAEAQGALSISPYSLEKPIYSGYATVGEMLQRKLPQYGGGVGTVNESFGNGGDGSRSISLRNLPGNRTLVLINGRRVTSEDLNLIPQSAIDRIDVLNDGASAIYGSDAVAGVVNIITKRGYSGAEFGARYGNTTSTDISSARANGVWGIATEKGSLTVGAEYSRANSQFSIDRDRSLPLPDAVSATSNPGTFTPRGLPANRMALRWSLVPGNTLGLTNSAQIPGGFDPFASIDRTGLTAQQAIAARNAEEARRNALLPANTQVRYGPSPSLTPGVIAGFPFGFYTLSVRPHERYGVFTAAEHQLFGENAVAFMDAFYSRNQSQNQLAPSPLGGRVLPPSNYWVNQVFPGAAGAGTDLTYGYRPVEIGPRITFTDFEEARLTAGLRGKIGDSTWKWETAFLYDRLEIDETQTGGVLADVYTGLLGGTTAATAWNPFGYTPIGGNTVVNSPAVVGSIVGQAGSKYIETLQSWDFKIDGTVFDLPGGPLAVAAGTELREENVDSIPDFALLNSLVFPFNADSAFRGKRDITSFFGEIGIPITGPEFNIPGFHSFSVQVAGRYEDFSDVGDTGLKPRIAFQWQPFDEQVKIHGSWAQGFVAPSLRSLDAGSPFVSFDELLNPLTRSRIQPEEGVVYVGNPRLEPSESESYLIGIAYSPNWLERFDIGANYYRIEEEGIPFTSSQYIVNQWWATGGSDNGPFGTNAAPSSVNPTGAQVELKGDGEFQQVRNVGPINTGKRLTDGIDMWARYVIETGFGDFTLEGSATRVLTFEQEDFPGAGTIDYLGFYWPSGSALGNYGFPEWKASAGLTYQYDRYTASVGWNFSAGYRELDFERNVSDYHTFDVRLAYMIPRIEAEISGGIINVTDERPPLVLSSFENGFDRAIGDIRQRQYYIALSKKF